MDFDISMKVAASGLKAQSGRMRVIAENISNADSTAKVPGGNPYRRKVPTFDVVLDREMGANVVELGRIQPDKSDFKTRYDPGHPAADEQGYVKLPNVNTLIEVTDMRQAQRGYEANLNIITAARKMFQGALDILRR